MTDDPKLQMAQRIADQLIPNPGNESVVYKSFHQTAVRAALAAIEECTERAAKLASAYAAACTPNVTIGDDDSIYLTDHEEGQKHAATVIAAKIRHADHLKGPPQ